MPIPEWIFANHWALLDGSRQWEAQTWRSTGIDWTTSSEVIDAFSWELGDKIYKAILGINKNPQPEDCQHNCYKHVYVCLFEPKLSSVNA